MMGCTRDGVNGSGTESDFTHPGLKGDDQADRRGPLQQCVVMKARLGSRYRGEVDSLQILLKGKGKKKVVRCN